ncbi:hypothetical protein YOLOSWAG_257 [Erwinia phage vB_EamM_Yoloswag]|uniref:Uncharacterized protein n=1 Tax=Erwinia phage vB_EamM_Yoloswag TaxID=1958956 RepID=A0A1S6L3G5_9CAUD|nr:hypothetical protein HOR66_gp257 [Erwinia phage vB_EamM_Yoloswag]AQT28731.1 hypothetical protein YOLOSWAG_257 [Erwinia phage vB_EamM_Yoloswag]
MQYPIDIVSSIMHTIITHVPNVKGISELKSSLTPPTVTFTLDERTYRVSGSLFVHEVQGCLLAGTGAAATMQKILRDKPVQFEAVSSVITGLVNAASTATLKSMAESMGWPDLDPPRVLRKCFREYLEKNVNEQSPDVESCREAVELVWLFMGSDNRQRLATSIDKQFGYSLAKNMDYAK